MSNRLFDKIKKLLQMFPEFRDSDQALYWDLLERKHLTREGFISKSNFLSAIPFETVSRKRRDVQEADRKSGDYKLQSSRYMKKLRDKQESVMVNKGKRMQQEY